MNKNNDFTFEKLMAVKKEILETKPTFKADMERLKKRSNALRKMSMKEVENYFKIYYIYTYGYWGY